MKKMKISSVVFALIVSGVSNAGIITEVKSDGNCKTESFQISSIAAVPAGPNIVGAPINSTSCLGFVTYPDNDFANNPNPNKGGLEDGLLNGEIVLTGPGPDKDGYYVAGDQFLTNGNDSMVDLNGDGIFDDPGWIRLGGAETETGGDWNFVHDSIGDLNLKDLITMSLSDDGTWSLEVEPIAIGAVTDELGRATVFDHLAFVMKGPNNGGDDFGSWAIYDFNFHDLIKDGLAISLGDTAYDFEGTWDVDMFNNDNALSHFSVWAHDPPATFDVPEPSTLAIFALGMIGLASRRFKKHL
jgi:hypothetical protein